MRKESKGGTGNFSANFTKRSLHPFTYEAKSGKTFNLDSGCLNRAALKAGGSKQELLYLQFRDIVSRNNKLVESADVNALWEELIIPGKAEGLAKKNGITLQEKSTRKSGNQK